MMWCTAFLVVLSFTCTTFAKSIPAGWPSCKRNDPNLNGCLLAATEALRETLVTKGAKEFGFPPISEFVLPSVQIQQEINPNLIVDIVSTNVSIQGLETYKFSEFNYDPTTFKWTAKLEFEYLKFKGDLDFNGKVFGNDVKEKGYGTIAIAKPKADLFLDGTVIMKKGKEYYHIDSAAVTLHLDPKSVEIIDASQFSPGVVRTVNQVLADEKGDNLKSILKAGEEVVAGIIKSLFGSIPDKIPYDKLFPKE